MLSLFKEMEDNLPKIDLKEVSRQQLISSLNKGQIPTWENFLKELPVVDDSESLVDVKSYYATLTEWDFLEELLKEDGTEFFLHAPEHVQVLRLDGKKSSRLLPLAKVDWQLWLEIVSIKFHQNWNVQTPFVSFYVNLFGQNYRLGLVHGSTSPNGVSKMVLRRLNAKALPLGAFGEIGELEELVRTKKNILFAGSTGSGKTSILTSLLQTISPEEHLVILEDTHEILLEHPSQTRFLAGETPQTSLKSYLAYSLRLSPDRIVLGEMRSHEVVPFLMAMNTGHSGLMGTLHSASAVDALHRVALLFTLYSGESGIAYEKVMELLCRNLEYVVFMEKKKVKEVIKVFGSENGVPFFEKIVHCTGAVDGCRN